jgi:hypothetical protein
MPPEGVASPSRISRSNGLESTAAITAGWVAHSKISTFPKSIEGRRPRLTLMFVRTAESSLYTRTLSGEALFDTPKEYLTMAREG